ncbi:UNVERIFIED_CONTAM: hypothetical protein PYX00_001367 [Menopon gallinae]|uniref:BTB domain-containing protein n=1 Tax=Menopon gallinae TaxID=328185 RepID=A0AAW2IDN4_9NEOP
MDRQGRAVKLRWNDFKSDITKACQLNRTSELFTDVTFIAQNRRLSAHKIVLSASSKFFKAMLIDIPSYVNPTITLSNISYEDLEAIIGYIYTGELPFSAEKLQSVLETAACFEIESLMQVHSAIHNDKKPGCTLSQGYVDNEVTVLNDIKMEMNDDYEACYADQPYPSITDNTVDCDITEDFDSEFQASDLEGQTISLSSWNDLAAEYDPLETSIKEDNCDENQDIVEVDDHYDNDGSGRINKRKTRRKNLRKKSFDDAVDAVVGGLSMTEAAWKFNVSRVRISKVIQEKVGSGAIPKRFNRSQKLRDPSLKELIKCALMGGHSLTKVARDFQMSIPAVYYYKKLLIEEGKLRPKAKKRKSMEEKTGED